MGKISYGLYLWHIPIFRVVEDQNWPRWLNVVVAVPLTVGATLGSFYLVEQRYLRLKHKFSMGEKCQISVSKEEPRVAV
jgi:peptidoglycan/LPS O-acetylase OafA/YrhL